MNFDKIIKQIKNNEVSKVSFAEVELVSSKILILLESLAKNISVTHLDLSNKVLNGYAGIIANIIEYNNSITYLNLSNCNLSIQDGSLSKIIRSLKFNRSITNLDLGNNFVQPDEIDNFARILLDAFKYNTSIIIIDLSALNNAKSNDLQFINISKIIDLIPTVNRSLMQYKDIDYMDDSFTNSYRTINTKNYELIEKIAKSLLKNHDNNPAFEKASFWANFFKYEELVREFLNDKDIEKLYDKAEKYIKNNFSHIPFLRKYYLDIIDLLSPLPSDIGNIIKSKLDYRETVFLAIINSKNLADQLIRAIQNDDTRLIESSLARISEFQTIDIEKVKRDLKNYMKKEETNSNHNSTNERIMAVIDKLKNIPDKGKE